MGSPLLAGAAALLVVLYWGLRRRTPPRLLRSIDTSAVAALNRAQIARLWEDRDSRAAQEWVRTGPDPDPAGGGGPADPAPVLPLVADARQRARLRDELERQLSVGDRAQRRLAMRTARHWGHPAVLPLLRRGLRDVDPAVVLEAARGLERFRRCPRAAAAAAAAPQPPLPRNVSRTR